MSSVGITPGSGANIATDQVKRDGNTTENVQIIELGSVSGNALTTLQITNGGLPVTGLSTPGGAPVGNPVDLAGYDGTNAQRVKVTTAGITEIQNAFGANWQDDGVANFGATYFPTATTYAVPTTNSQTVLSIPLGTLLSNDNPWMLTPGSVQLGILNGAYASGGPSAAAITSLTFLMLQNIGTATATLAYPIPLNGSTLAGATSTPNSSNLTTAIVPELNSGVYPSMALLAGFNLAPNDGTITVQVGVSSQPTTPTLNYFSKGSTVTITDNTTHSVLAAAATGLRNWVQQVIIANSSASPTVVTLFDGGNSIAVEPMQAYTSQRVSWPGDGIPMGNGNALQASSSASVASVYVTPFARLRANQGGID